MTPQHVTVETTACLSQFLLFARVVHVCGMHVKMCVVLPNSTLKRAGGQQQKCQGCSGGWPATLQVDIGGGSALVAALDAVARRAAPAATVATPPATALPAVAAALPAAPTATATLAWAATRQAAPGLRHGLLHMLPLRPWLRCMRRLRHKGRCRGLRRNGMMHRLPRRRWLRQRRGGRCRKLRRGRQRCDAGGLRRRVLRHGSVRCGGVRRQVGSGRPMLLDHRPPRPRHVRRSGWREVARPTNGGKHAPHELVDRPWSPRRFLALVLSGQP